MNDLMNSYGTVTGPAEVRFERLLPGPIETIWSFLVDSDKRGEWLASGSMEARAGGKVTLRFQNADLSPHKAPAPEKYRGFDDKVHETVGTITQWDPPRLLAFTWPESSEVTFELKPEGDRTVFPSRLRRRKAAGKQRQPRAGCPLLTQSERRLAAQRTVPELIFAPSSVLV